MSKKVSLSLMPNHRHLFSIIIVNYKTYQFLNDCLISIKKSDYHSFETIVFDNSSQAQEINKLKKQFPGVKFITTKKNLGFVTASNRAAKIASGQFLFFLNPDTKIHPHCLSLLAKKSFPLAACKIKNYQGTLTHHCGIGLDILGFPVVNPKKIFYAEGSALFISKKLFSRLKGFDSQYFMFHEDVDLCWRAQLLGFPLKAIKQAVVYHAVGISAGGTTPSKKQSYQTSLLRRYYSERNNIRTLLKNYSSLTLLFILPLYLLHNLFEFIFFILTLKAKIIYYYLKAYLWNLVHLSSTLKLRYHVQKTRQISDWQILRRLSFTSGKFVNLLKLGIPRFK